MIIKLEPEFRDYMWGGSRLRPGKLTAEAWVVYEGNRISEGVWAGSTLGDVSLQMGPALLGSGFAEKSGSRFPLLIKLLDCANWLSVQVHPNDEQAVQIEGLGHWGKTEAWHILDAEPDALLIAGVKPGTSRTVLADAIQNNTLLDFVEYQYIQPGDTIFMPAGTIHALGPGLLVYEVQQTSDLTYRVFDWNRPASPNRPLHIQQSLLVSNPELSGRVQHLPEHSQNDCKNIASSLYFNLELLVAKQVEQRCDTLGASFHALTVISGQASVFCGSGQVTLHQYETALLSADSGCYQVRPLEPLRMLRASVPGV